MYMLIAAALVISMIITVAPAQRASADVDVYAEWDRVTTPTTDGWVLAPNSTIIDYALASNGEVAYAVVMGYEDGMPPEPMYLLKSDDHAATWDDITEALEDADDGATIDALVQVATDWEDPDFVAVALRENGQLRVYFSTDGGDTFEDNPGEVVDGSVYLSWVADLAVSYEDDGERVIAIGGEEWDSMANNAGLFLCTVTGESAGSWEDATDITDYPGWDNTWPADFSGDLNSMLVTDIIFSPNWDEDETILVTTVAPGSTSNDAVYLQCGTSGGWNEKSKLGIEAVPIKDNVPLPSWPDPRGIAGMTLPNNYDSTDTASRVLWVWVNYYDSSMNPANEIVRVEDADAGTAGPMSQIKDGKVWLTNISYQGTIAEGKAIAGVLGTGTDEVFTACCSGVQVYRNDGIANMIICCKPWKSACKPPTGRTAMAVSYVGDDKAYGVNLWGVLPYDESAWSVTFDDGDTWNQLSLIDTHIDYLSDVAVSPDCNKTMLVSVNLIEVDGEGPGPCGCDSVWLHAVNLPEAEEYSGQWIRTWCGMLEGVNTDVIPGDQFPQRGLLRLPPASEETTGDTVILVDRMSGNVYWDDLEGLGCWDSITSTEVTDIVDLAVLDEDTLFALGATGKVSMFDDDDWQDAVASKVDNGWTVAVYDDDGVISVLVGGQSGDVSHSDDGGETFEALEDVATDGYVTVAFDSYFGDNDAIYAALANSSKNGIYRWVIGESDAWTNLRADPHDYTGLVVDNADGNPKTGADTGGVVYASYIGHHDAGTGAGCATETDWYTGVARRLYPTEQVICGECGEWDYLTLGLSDVEQFIMAPDALKICGCLTPDSNSKLFAIDGAWYDMDKFLTGSVWMFEDCYAKKAPEITSPVDGFVVPADPCSCYSVPFTIVWDRLCDACSYSIEFALDEEFTMPVSVNNGADLTDITISGATPSYSIMGGEAGGLSCEMTYYYRVRAANAENCQIIHSWWSDPIEITIAPSTAAGQIALVSPVPGATDVAIKKVGFSWNLMAKADAFDWVLDDNSDFSSPVESKIGLTSKAYECTKTLSYDTTYYWMVTAYNEGAAISMSAVGTFRTMEEPAGPVDPEPYVTPFWVWVVIAIGAVLVIVVIVLIFRTRRV